MSLTSFLRERDVRERFNAEFQKPKPVLRSETFVEPRNPTHAQLVGTAFDYVLRLHLAIINESVWERTWIAEDAVERLELALSLKWPVFVPGSQRSTRGLLAKSRRFIEDAKDHFDQCCETGEVSDDMLRSALLLAQLDAYYRCGLLGHGFGEVDNADVVDLRALYGVLTNLAESPFSASKLCVLNPDFGKASKLVRGADADVLIDETLIELKTTKQLQFSAEMFRQLMGYYALHEIGGIAKGIRPKPKIHRLGVYFSRFGAFVSIPVESVVNSETFPAFLRWFKERAQQGPPPEVFTIQDDDLISTETNSRDSIGKGVGVPRARHVDSISALMNPNGGE